VLPPSLLGVNGIEACPLAKVTVPIVGAAGTPGVVNGADTPGKLSPALLVATTLNTYVIPGANPDTVVVPEAAGELTTVDWPPGTAVTVIFVTVDPPLKP
jgi:hypothetical protein